MPGVPPCQHTEHRQLFPLRRSWGVCRGERLLLVESLLEALLVKLAAGLHYKASQQRLLAGTQAAVVFFAYNGYNAACNMAEEVRHAVIWLYLQPSWQDVAVHSLRRVCARVLPGFTM